jgi:hypothetical protein
MRLKTLAITTAAVGALLTAAPSHAQQVRVTDPSGDAEGPGLDIVSVRVDNRDYRVVAWVRFAEDARGDVIVSTDRRRGTGLRMVSEHRPAGDDKSFLAPGAFTDRSAGPDVDCPGFRAVWQEDRPVVRMSLPARCLNSGNYGAIRFAALTERRDDTDFAPEDPDVSSEWLSRG